jgi:hypothetical protein
LATSDDVQGLVAQGNTLQSTLEIARDVAKRLIESQSDTLSFGTAMTAGASFSNRFITVKIRPQAIRFP